MNARAVMPDEIRPAIRIAKLAEAWDCDVTQIRRLVDAGEIEAYGIGRALRVYLDSASDYQLRKAVTPKGRRHAPRQNSRQRASVDNAAHRAAMATLRRQGIA